MKKTLLTLITSVALAASLPPAAGSAADGTIVLYDGKLSQDRVLMPLRSIATNLDADVQWNQSSKTVTVTKGEQQLAMEIGAHQVFVNQIPFSLDEPAQLINNTTYLPLRIVGKLLGADISWNNADKSAAVVLGSKRIVIHTEPLTGVPVAPQISKVRLQALLNKADEAIDVSGIKQIRTHFRPYFTDKLINVIIQAKGLPYDYRFKRDDVRVGYYDSNKQALVYQSSAYDKDGKYDKSAQFLSRNIHIILTAEGWKADSITYQMEERYP